MKRFVAGSGLLVVVVITVLLVSILGTSPVKALYGPELIANPSFETVTMPWTGWTGYFDGDPHGLSWEQASVLATPDPYSVILPHTGACFAALTAMHPDSYIGDVKLSSDQVPCDNNFDYAASGWYAKTYLCRGDYMRMSVVFFDYSGGSITGETVGDPVDIKSDTSIGWTQWNLTIAKETVPPGTAYANISFTISGSGSNPIVNNGDPGLAGFAFDDASFKAGCPPVVYSITPSVGDTDSAVHATVQGEYFSTGDQVSLTALGHQIDATDEEVDQTGTSIECNLGLTDALPGPWNVVVTNDDGQYGSLSNGFTVKLPPPIIDTVEPNNMENLTITSTPIHVEGHNFELGDTEVKLKRGTDEILPVGYVMYENYMDLNFNPDAVAANDWELEVKNGDGQTASFSPFGIWNPMPDAVSNLPTDGSNNNINFNLTINGGKFARNCTVRLLKAGQTPIVGSVTRPGSSQIDATFNINGAAVGDWNVEVTNPQPEGGTDTINGGLHINFPTPPNPTGMNPSRGYNNESLNDVPITGSGFYGFEQPGNANAVKLVRGSTTINGTDVQLIGQTSFTADFNLNGAEVGAYNVVVKNADGQQGTFTGGFTVYQQSTWYLAEGSTNWGFDTYISILNPNDTEVGTTLRFFTSSTPLTKTLTLPANSQTAINTRDYVGSVDFSTSVEADNNKPIAVDRTMSWTGPGATAPEAHSSVGVTSAAKTWYLAEGSTAWDFECWLLIQNPNNQDATCKVTYMTDAGPQEFNKVVPANTRQTYNMASDIGSKDASIKVEGSVPVIAERSMYRYNRREGHESIGTTAPSNDYYLAEGTTAWGFQTWVLVQNPNNANNDITVEFSNGITTSFTMAPETRNTVNVNSLAPKADVATHVHGSLPVVAERSMYWNSYAGETCHDSIGLSAAHKNFYLPDGSVTNGWETWTLVQNPNDKQVTVNVTYLARDGSKAPVTFQEAMPAKSRKTFNMADKVDYNCGIKVTCSDPIMVERSMYRDNRATGTNTIGGFSD